jgi:phage terminase large subunit-like protein
MIDVEKITRRWIRNVSDEKAFAAGCRFHLERACYVVWWIERYCRLYEGQDWAGEPLILRGSPDEPLTAIMEEWEDGGRELSLKRAERYMDYYESSRPVDWQYECTMRLFGWVRYSQHWKREVRRFRQAFIVVGKKNKKTPTISALALYLECGDREQGQKVFLAAKDAQQVRGNMSLHILQMIERSPELRRECKINLNEMKVTHLETNSILMPLTSGNLSTEKSKEGLNGSVIVDETHVVSGDLMGRITRMGISRPEPIRIEVTTAGDDPDSYGHDRYEYAKQVLEGQLDNDELFVAIYEAPQTVSDNEIDDDPIKYGMMANPAWGHTIDPEEYLNDYRTSRPSIKEFSRFKMYRLNVWQRSANPWIRSTDWEKCRRPFTAEDLHGRVCGAGLDLGKTDDMSSLSLVFPDNPDAWVEAAREIKEAGPEAKGDDAEITKRIMVLVEQPVKLLTFYWLPEESVEKFRGDAPYPQWLRDGWLRTYPGGTVDSTAITEELRAVLAQYDCKMFVYDPWYAAPIIKVLLGQNVLPEDYTWKFAQTMQNYAWPAALLERLILAGNLHHDGNPITRWEMGHVQAKEDNNGNLRPVKPKRGDAKKIDGVVSACMGVDAATRLAVNISVYESRGILSV